MPPASPLPEARTVRVLGCSGALAAGQRTTAFLVGEHLLIDAGSGVGDLPLDALVRIDHVVLTHAHLDHVLALPLLADTVLRERLAPGGRGPIHVHALPETLAALQAHVFNGVIWPDFTRLPTAATPILVLHPVAIGAGLELAGCRLRLLPAAHVVPALGVAIETPAGAWVYTGDTGPNPALTAELAGRPLAGLVIETAFGDEASGVAACAGHLTPRTLVETLAGLPASVPVWITHTKPGESARVLAQVQALGPAQRVQLLDHGQRFELA